MTDISPFALRALADSCKDAFQDASAVTKNIVLRKAYDALRAIADRDEATGAFIAAFDTLVAGIEEAGEDGGCWDDDPMWGPVIRARASIKGI